jgi:hypothetical protein
MPKRTNMTAKDARAVSNDAAAPEGAAVRAVLPPHLGFLHRAQGSLPEAVRESDLAVLNEGLAFLFARLREARRLFNQEGDGGRSSAFEALGGLWMFIALFDRPLAECLHTPVLSLMSALAALDTNLVEPMLAPTPRRGRAPASHARLALKGHVAMTVDRLVQSGLSLPAAYKKVAAVLATEGVRPERGSGVITSHTVRNWCTEVKADVGGRGTAAYIYRSVADYYREKFANLPSDEARRRFALNNITSWVRETFPGLKKAT